MWGVCVFVCVWGGEGRVGRVCDVYVCMVGLSVGAGVGTGILSESSVCSRDELLFL